MPTRSALHRLRRVCASATLCSFRRVCASATLRFFILGAALLVARGVLARLAPRERPVAEVVAAPDVDEAALRRRIDEAILVEEALRFGWATSDPVVRRRLAMNMAFTAGEAPPASDAAIRSAAIDEALALGMERTDPVVRGRLVYRMERLLEAPGDEDAPNDAELEAHLRAHRERFEPPTRIAFIQVLLRRDRHADLEGDAASLLARLRSEATSAAEAIGLGDPMPLLPPRQHASVVALDRSFGAGFGAAVAGAPLGAWAGPIPSSYGLHLVFVEAREAGRLPALRTIRARVLADYEGSRRRARRTRRLDALRSRYEVRVVRPRAPS
jgi:hypothetical protein